MKKHIVSAVLLSAVTALSGCTASSEESAPVSGRTAAPVTAEMINSEGIKIGTAVFADTGKGVSIRLKAEGLPPGIKAIHIHETGKCDKPDFKTAGGHFNPKKKQHGFDNPKGYHAGDLPNIEINEKGKVDVELQTADVTLMQGKKNSLLDEDGSSLIIHESKDDYQTDPAGNAGNRIACGAIVN
ncbi:superoxide dismutase family protein [Metabacillus sp. cB07]|uniref:superoxide dismutase family protein n=1 Tax=Metabacillus sp. cB07 TaxID=2806989 RepID=UPI0019392DE1|nr:superoxide dismutase family protein [Metabacillus sp. cB07]